MRKVSSSTMRSSLLWKCQTALHKLLSTVYNIEHIIKYEHIHRHIFLCSNHSWMSFQGFSESYNDTSELPKETGMIYMPV